MELKSIQSPLKIDPKDIRVETSLSPVALPSGPAGFAAGAAIQSDLDREQRQLMSILIAAVMKDPLLQRQLCDRVYVLLLEDMRHRRAHVAPYEVSRW